MAMAGNAPEWMMGSEALEDNDREWIIHTATPRFIARIVIVGDDGLPLTDDDRTADVVTGLTFSFMGDSHILCEFDWIDPPPADPDDVMRLLLAAATALEIYTQDSEEGR